jgi:cellulose synthase operon protein C
MTRRTNFVVVPGCVAALALAEFVLTPQAPAVETSAPAVVSTPVPSAGPPTSPVGSPPTAEIRGTLSTEENAAVVLLVRQGDRWLERGRPELAISSAERALSAQPNNIEALLLAARASVARGDHTAARAYVERLRGAGATAEQQTKGQDLLRQASVDPAALEEARQLARKGRVDEAAAHYQSLFGAGGPPQVYAREYYQVLASAESTRAIGQRGLARLAEEPYATDDTLLAYAQVLTYTPSSRAEGISRLASLSERPTVRAEAQAAWKQALGFYGNDPAVLPLMAAYLARFPNDADIIHQEQALRAERLAASIAGPGRARAQGKPVEMVPPPRTRASNPPPSGGGAVGSSATDRARAQAAETSDPQVQVALLSNAMNAAPNDPWVRLDLARALRRIGRGAEGRAIMEELVARQSTPDTFYAAALLAQEDGRKADASALLARIPLAHLTPDMARLQTRLRQQQEVASAAALLPSAPSEARQRLLALAARPDPTGGTAADVIRAFGNAGDGMGADEAARTAEMVNPQPAARIAIAGALLAAGRDTTGNAMIAQLDTTQLTGPQRHDVALLRSAAAIRLSDKLNESGDQAAAFERLRPALVSDPDNPEVQLALARLYLGANRPAEAMHIAETLLTRDPHNVDARQVAVDAAIASGDRDRAETLASEGAAISPGDSRTTLLQAKVARSAGDNSRASALLAEAAAQRQTELGATSATTATTGPAVLQNPFASSGGGAPTPGVALPTDPVARQIAQEQTALRADTASRASGGVAFRARSGTAGLDQLNDVSAPLEASIVPEGIGGRVTAHVTPVLLDNGSLSGTENIKRFGSNAGAGTLATPDTSTATGAGLDVSYQRDKYLTADIGTSPLGFPVSTVVGGIEVAPKLSDEVTLRLRGERRIVTDSLLSYAGERDPVSGITWGGVARSGGHAQLETGLGAGGYAYAGGGYNFLGGQHVAGNNEVEAGAGFGYPIYKQGDSTLVSGLNLVYFSYENNQRGFTLGQGGYFSPQNFDAVEVPLDWRSKWGKLEYQLRGSVGYMTFKEDGSPLFPLDPELQSAADAAAAVNPSVPTHNLAQTKTGLIGGVRMDLRYPLTDQVGVAGGVRFNQAPQWDETNVYLRLESEF